MRDRRQTIAALRRLADRPGTPHEGDTARRMLRKMEANNPPDPPPMPPPKPFDASRFPRGTNVFYNRWAYPINDPCVVLSEPKIIEGQTWIRMKFQHLKQPRWVPVTSSKGCHISILPLDEIDALYLIMPV